MSDSSSCLVQKLSNFVDLSATDEELLARLEESERRHPEDVRVYECGDALESLLVVKSGWLYSGSLLANGRHQVLEIHYPGDIIGMPHIPFNHMIYDLHTSTECVLCPFPKQHLDAVFAQSPRLTAMLYTVSMLEQAALFDRVRAIARMSARDRICHFLLEVHARLGVTGVTEGAGSFRLPLTQTVIGDALGLTNVSVSRVLGELEREAIIRRRGRQMELLEIERMREATEFENRFESVDTSWFPSAEA